MPLIEWRNEYAVGVPSVDHEHRELIGLINELHERLESGEGGLTAVEFLGEINARISAHFALEERIMRENAYDEYQDHKNDHEVLLDEIRDIMDEVEDNQQLDEQELAERLRAWFTEHFSTRDARLHRRLIIPI